LQFDELDIFVIVVIAAAEVVVGGMSLAERDICVLGLSIGRCMSMEIHTDTHS
jgi:hypothetical protein